MADLKPAYLIHGDDHGAVAERRAGLRALVERQEGGGASIELLEGDAATPAGVADALAAMTLAMGRRVIIVEGAERWREADIAKHLAGALADVAPETTLAIFAREEARAKVPAALHKLVDNAGGQIVAQMTVKPWELAKWAREQASRLGVSLDAAAAKALVAQVGERQQRLLRELEKLALEGDCADAGAGADAESSAAGAPRHVTVEDIESRAAHSNEWRAYALADALVGADAREATLSYMRLREQGERVSGLTYLMAQRLRDALAIAQRLHAGESVAEVKRGLRMPARAAERFVADVARSDVGKLQAALGELAELELNTRGGAPLASSRTALAPLSEDTLALHAIEVIGS
jgi:DNA polymerase-3 subunit delta